MQQIGYFYISEKHDNSTIIANKFYNITHNNIKSQVLYFNTVKLRYRSL